MKNKHFTFIVLCVLFLSCQNSQCQTLSVIDSINHNGNIDSLNKNLLNYVDCGDFHNGLAYVIDTCGKIGYINKKGKLIIPCVYLQRTYKCMNDFSDGFCVVSQGKNKFGVIDTLGNFILPLKYKYVSEIMGDNIYRVIDSNNVASYINKEGVKTFEKVHDYTYIGNFHDRLACVIDKYNKKGFINQNGELVIPCIYDDCHSFSCGYSLCTIKDTVYYIDTLNNRVRLPENQRGHDFINGYAVFEWKGKCGAYNRNFEVVVPPIYDKLNMFSSFYIATKRLKQIIVNNGETVWKSTRYKISPNSSNGHFIISNRGRCVGVVDSTGTSIMNDQFDEIDCFVNDYAVVRKDGKMGLVNMNLELVIPCEYDECAACYEGYVLTKKGNAFKYIWIK